MSVPSQTGVHLCYRALEWVRLYKESMEAHACLSKGICFWEASARPSRQVRHRWDCPCHCPGRAGLNIAAEARTRPRQAAL